MTTDSFTIEGYASTMRDDNLGARTIEEYSGIVKRGLAAADPMTYIKSIANAGSRMMPIAAFQRWAAYTGDTTLGAALAAYKKKLRHHIPPSKERQAYLPEEMERMASSVGDDGRNLPETFALKMLLGTGARSSDICSGITREVLQLSQRNGGKAEIRTKGNRLRQIDFSPFAKDVKALLSQPGWEYLYELLAPATDDRPCSNKRGYRILDLRFKDLCKACKVSEPHITHRCRHTIASRVYRQTKDLMATRNWFGWASTQTAERYSHGDTFDEINKSVSDVLPHFDEPKKPKGKKR